MKGSLWISDSQLSHIMGSIDLLNTLYRPIDHNFFFSIKNLIEVNVTLRNVGA